MAVIESNIVDNVAVLTIATPTVGAFYAGARVQFSKLLDDVLADDGVKAIVFQADGNSFPSALDVAGLGQPSDAPSLSMLCAKIEQSPKPVVAVMHGRVFNDGFELALAAHFRVAHQNAVFGIRTIEYAIPPGAGTTQRLPRLVSAKIALDLLLDRQTINAENAARLGLLDGLAKEDVHKAGLNYAKSLLAKDVAIERTSDKIAGSGQSGAFQEEIANRRANLPENSHASVTRTIDCVEAAQLLTFQMGVDFESVAHSDCLENDRFIGLRHATLAERAATRSPAGKVRQNAIKTVGVIGAGTMGGGTARACVEAGLKVVVYDRDLNVSKALKQRLDTVWAQAVEAKQITAEDHATQVGRLDTANDLRPMSSVDLVIEAVTEDLETKHQVFAELTKIVPTETILASNTDSLSISEIATRAGIEGRLVGLHFFRPALAAPMVEISLPETADGAAASSLYGFVRKLRKAPVGVGLQPGYVSNQLLNALRYGADEMVMMGAAPYHVDTAMRGFGFPIGPYQALDRMGLDASAAQRGFANETLPKGAARYDLVNQVAALGRNGQKSGLGFYHYGDGNAQKDPAMEEIVATIRGADDAKSRNITQGMVQRRCLYAVANAGAKLIQNGTAASADVIDATMILNHNFPRRRGGPMLACEQVGLQSMVTTLRRWAEVNPYWKPSRALVNAVKNGQKFPR